MTKKKRIILSVSLGILEIIVIVALLLISYLGSSYKANDSEVNTYLKESNVTIKELDRRTTAFVPENPKAGFIFYPGGKVEAEAYHPLMAECAKNDILSIIVEMPFNLAVFNINGANGIKEQYPEIEKWYIGGHSLGGSMASSYLSKNQDDFCGLILLGSYSTVDFSDTSLKVLSIYGEKDEVMNREKYEKYKTNLPAYYTEHIVIGGNHAGFGMYGEQLGDGEATITNEKQIKETALEISNLMEK